MAPIIADNLIESGCEFVDNSNTTTSAAAQISETFYSEVEESSSSSSASAGILLNDESVVVVKEAEDKESVKEEVNKVCDVDVKNEYQSDGIFMPRKQMPWEPPTKQGLYDPQNEHEACGVGFIVAIDGKRCHKVSLKETFFFYCSKRFHIDKVGKFCITLRTCLLR